MRPRSIQHHLKIFTVAAAVCLMFGNCSKHEEQPPGQPAEQATSEESAATQVNSAVAPVSIKADDRQNNGTLQAPSSGPGFEVTLQPSNPATGDRLTAQVKFTREEQHKLMLHYLWLINGQKVQESGDPHLNQAIRRDDFVELQVRPADDFSPEAARSCSTFVGNAPPQLRLLSQSLDQAGQYRAQIHVSDPEEDAVTLSLTESPSGMRMDPQSQTLRWVLGPAQQGTFDVALSASDVHGAETLLTYQIRVGRQQAERNATHEIAPANSQ
ncbi:Ig domain-containing protein [Desulfoferrobacter suflitae]|uniref:Ig domain-containing protein n=1 Tax=Desulfoferrobacter suflitae TaxID=2865782 RepID=UPI002164A9BD|nr:Ig domain-containing protein [Desulfoferrobacter suflitae]MCK8602477.1 Ig domain-containing protein [Desulfoferrobacter suflitae]